MAESLRQRVSDVVMTMAGYCYNLQAEIVQSFVLGFGFFFPGGVLLKQNVEYWKGKINCLRGTAAALLTCYNLAVSLLSVGPGIDKGPCFFIAPTQ